MAGKTEIKTPFKDRVGPHCVGEKGSKKRSVLEQTVIERL